MGGEEVNSHCRGQKAIFFMDYVMYFLLAVVKELVEGLYVHLECIVFSPYRTCHVPFSRRDFITCGPFFFLVYPHSYVIKRFVTTLI